MRQGLALAATGAVLLSCCACVRLDGQDAAEVKSLNCKRPLGALVLNTEDAQKSLAKWRSLPAVHWSNMPPSPVFIMLVYDRISFPQAWEAVFNSSTDRQVSFKLLVHAKDEIAQKQLPPFFQSRFVANFQQTKRCSAVNLVLNLLSLCLKARAQASHFVILSGDAMPTKPLSHMLKDIETESRSRFCVDPELRRAETFFSMRRDLASFVVSHFEKLFAQIVPATSCPDEDMFYWSAFQRGEGTVNSCIQLSDWSGTDKEWKSNAERCECPKFLASGKLKPASCARPSLWGAITRSGLRDVFESPAGYWLIRKFPGDKVPGSCQLIEDDALAAWKEEHGEKSGNADASALDTDEGGDDEIGPRDVKGVRPTELLDTAAARMIVEKRSKLNIPLLVVPDAESDTLQSLRKSIDINGVTKRDLAKFPAWKTFNRIDANGVKFGKSIGMLATAFD